MASLNPSSWFRSRLSKLWEASIDGHVVSLAWSSPLGLIAAASADGPIVLFDARTGHSRHTLAGHGFGTACVAWSADGKYLASAGQDGKVRTWDPATGKQIKEMPGGAAWVERVAWCPTANLLASAAGKKLRLWNLDGVMLREFPDHPSTIMDFQWKPKSSVLASTAYGKLFFWDAQAAAATTQPKPMREFSWAGSMLALAWSPDSKHIAAGAQDCTVHFWVLKTGDDLQMSGYPTKVRELAWDATGRYLATGGGPTPCVWDFAGRGPAGSTPVQLEGHQDNVNVLTYQRQGPLLASGGDDGLIFLWQPDKQKNAITQVKHNAAVSQLAWSADDRQLAVGAASGEVVLFSVAQ